jgi:hypothetical protein
MSFQSKKLREKAVELNTKGHDLMRAGLATTEQRMKFDEIMSM